jgi:hypothetical protein
MWPRPLTNSTNHLQSSPSLSSSSSSSLYGYTAQVGPWPPCWGFVTITFLRVWIVSPAPNPQPGGPDLRIYDRRRQGGPTVAPGTGSNYTPRHWVPILVAFYDMHGIQWDYSLIPATTRDTWIPKIVLNYYKEVRSRA